MKIPFLSLSILLLMLNYSIAQDTKGTYKVAGKISLEGDGGWDYLTVDENSNRLYVSHGTMVQVVDLDAGKLIGTIPDTKGVHGIAIATDLNKGFISDGKDTAVTIFDLKTFETIAKIKVTGNNPDAIVYDKFSHTVLTFNGKGKNATVIDAKKNTVIGTITLNGKPEFAVVDGKGKLYVNFEDKSVIAEIDITGMKVLNTWPLAPGESPTGLAFDVKNRRLFSACDNKMLVVVDADNGKVITTVPIGENVDGAAFDPKDGGTIFSSNGDGTLTVIKEENPDTYSVVQNLTTKHGARTIAVNTKTNHVYLPTAEFMPLTPASHGAEKVKPKVKPGTFMVLDVVPN